MAGVLGKPVSGIGIHTRDTGENDREICRFIPAAISSLFLCPEPRAAVSN